MASERVLSAHDGHERILVSMSWGEREECRTCNATLAIWNDDGDLRWVVGDSLAILHHYLRDRDYPERKPNGST